MQRLFEQIPIEQWLVFLGGLFAFISTIAYGAWKLFVLWFNQRMEKERISFQLANDAEKLRVQNQLDNTEYSRETTRAVLMELSETRKEDGQRNERLQLAFEKQDERHNEHLKNITDVSRGVENLLATSLQILQDHKELAEVSDIKQQKIILQNDTTHSRLTEITADLSSLAKKLETMTMVRDSDRRTLEDIATSILSLKTYIETLNDKIITQALPYLDEKGNIIMTIGNRPSLSEKDKELSEKTNESDGLNEG